MKDTTFSQRAWIVNYIHSMGSSHVGLAEMNDVLEKTFDFRTSPSHEPMYTIYMDAPSHPLWYNLTTSDS